MYCCGVMASTHFKEERSKVKQNGVKGGEGWMTEDESEELW